MQGLKKVCTDLADVKNYRPISNLTFMSKIIERLVCRQLTAFVDRHRLLPDLQSAYRRQHSTETAVFKVVSDILKAADDGNVTLLDRPFRFIGRFRHCRPCYFIRSS